ncbi:hypothetical protein K440DRAFT_17892 [Wilcoxina mikolae CBS 423.85]|nr:hypothetical protein K440DRAFT_17892 [Wilcoxina mikolae CBS 423.85]
MKRVIGIIDIRKQVERKDTIVTWNRKPLDKAQIDRARKRFGIVSGNFKHDIGDGIEPPPSVSHISEKFDVTSEGEPGAVHTTDLSATIQHAGLRDLPAVAFIDLDNLDSWDPDFDNFVDLECGTPGTLYQNISPTDHQTTEASSTQLLTVAPHIGPREHVITSIAGDIPNTPTRSGMSPHQTKYGLHRHMDLYTPPNGSFRTQFRKTNKRDRPARNRNRRSKNGYGRDTTWRQRRQSRHQDSNFDSHE